MTTIKILDSTLRDGGYTNNWNFGKNNIQGIISGLTKSNIDYIEYGFYNPKSASNPNLSLYNKFDEINLTNFITSSKLTVMVNFGEFNSLDIIKNNPKHEIRIAFKKKDLGKLIESITPLKDANLAFSLNAMHISLYSESELHRLVEIANTMNTRCLTAVDTMGIMNELDVEKIFTLFDNFLDKNTSIGFHSHNNLNLSMSNVKKLLSLNLNRTIIIDSCLGGLGRGGGILKTERICQILNDKYNANYDIELLKNLSKYYILPIIKKSDFKNKIPYLFSAKNKCHPNYAKYLVDNNIPENKINYFLSKLPDANKAEYSEALITNLLHNNQQG